MTAAAPLAGATALGLSMAFWPVRPDIVRDNLARFVAASGIAVDPVEIAGDYAAEVERRHAAGAPPDVLYAQRGEASRWMARGLIRPLNDLPGVHTILAEMLPGIAESSRDAAGRVLGLTYYNAGPFCLFRNEGLLGIVGRRLEAADGGHPESWDEVLRDVVRLQRRGASSHPLLLRWHDGPTGLTWAFLAECFAEGDHLVDADLRCTFGPDTGAAGVIARWQRVLRDRLVPPDLLNWPDAAFDAAWMGGGHAYYPTMDYLISVYADDPASRIRGEVGINPVLPGRTHDTLLLGHALLCLSNRPRDAAALEAAWGLLRFLGYRDAAGQLFVHRRWVEALNLWVPFPAIYQDPGSRRRMRGWHHPSVADEALSWQLAGRARALRPRIVTAPWYLDWCAVFRRIVRADLLAGGTSPDPVLRALQQAWEALA